MTQNQNMTPQQTLQAEAIAAGIASGVDIKHYADTRYTGEQMHEIRKGLESGVDVKIYKSRKFNAEQMEQIRLGLEHDLRIGQVNAYAETKFNAAQMEQIRLGLESELGLVAFSYRDHQISAEDMCRVREELLRHGVTERDGHHWGSIEDDKLLVRAILAEQDISLYANLTYDGTREFIQEQLAAGEDVSLYAKDTYCKEQMVAIATCLKENLDPSPLLDVTYYASAVEPVLDGIRNGDPNLPLYANPEYSRERMEMIKLGIQMGLDEKFYNNDSYNDNQLEVMLDALRQNIRIDQYADARLSEQSLKLIVGGLKRGLDVELYTQPNLEYQEREFIFRELKDGADPAVVARYAKPEYGRDMFTVANGFDAGVDVTPYLEAGKRGDELVVIKDGLIAGVDVDPWLDKGYAPRQLQVLFTGLSKGIDVSPHIRDDQRPEELMNILVALEHGVDVNKWLGKNYTPDQLYELFAGEATRIDVSQYADCDDPRNMHAIRILLTHGQTVPDDIKNDPAQLSHALHRMHMQKFEEQFSDGLHDLHCPHHQL